MNWTRASQDITQELAPPAPSFDIAAPRAALARDTVYMPSELAARLLPAASRRERDALTWERATTDVDRPAPVR